MGGTVAYKMQHGQSTAFTAEIIEMHGEGEDARVVFFCDRVIWSMFDVNVLPSTYIHSYFQPLLRLVVVCTVPAGLFLLSDR